ncbi:hypothetical protein GDO81_008721 [Engystomops pustulosus]|uniref:Uncharacterized protein n=1 Tax=Engystomops pustulosus TaxID=76066 RepID=A0AAV7CHA8_ENGPU|nr:hypothetical protein GDO81_008721 [Engystomops pustulosus]
MQNKFTPTQNSHVDQPDSQDNDPLELPHTGKCYCLPAIQRNSTRMDCVVQQCNQRGAESVICGRGHHSNYEACNICFKGSLTPPFPLHIACKLHIDS